MGVVMKASNLVNRLLKPLDNKVLGTTARVALILYASLIAPELPDNVARYLDNVVVRGVLIFLIAYLSLKDPITAALATLGLMVTVMSLHRRDVQSVLGKTVGRVANLAEDVVEGAVDFVGDVTSNVLGLEQAAEEVAEVAEAGLPSGLEQGLDNAGSV